MNITKEGEDMSFFDEIEDMETKWKERYDFLLSLGNKTTPAEDMELYKLKVRLGYATPKNPDVECFGCGS